jgi:hypothetical protein
VRVLVIICLVVNTGAGLALAVTRGGFLGQMGLPPPLPFYADLLAVFLVGIWPGLHPRRAESSAATAISVDVRRGGKLLAALLFVRLWLTGMAGWLPAWRRSPTGARRAGPAGVLRPAR